MKKIGTLFGLGVGPGDPDLLTIKAAKILGRVGVVFAASSTRNDYSVSLGIASPHLAPSARIVRLGFPMTRDAAALAEAWEANAAAVAGVLETGQDAAFLTLGDPSLYSTFGYILPILRRILPEAAVEIVPGVTSFQAAAAKTGRPLAESGENLLVLSGVGDDAAMRRALGAADNAVIMKAYRNFPAIRQALDDLGLTEKTAFVTRLGLEGEEVFESLADAPEKPHYFSLCLMRKG